VADISGDQVGIEPGEVLVERKIVPAQRDRTAPYGWIVLFVFIATCVVVFFGEKFGIRAPAPETTAQSAVGH
jgi:hypothetical protein